MAGRQRCGNSGGTTTVYKREEIGKQSREQEEMPMCRHVNRNRGALECSGVERQLWQTNRLLDEQNRLLGQLLRAVQGQ